MPRKRAVADVSRRTSSEVRRRVITAIESAAREDGFDLDHDQHRAAEALASTAALIVAGEAPAVYLWGPVGRGKTWLLDAFVRCWPPHAARRFHFHRFFREFHETRHRRGYGAASVSRTVEDLVGGATVVCFDELFAHETGDAYLFTSILTDMRDHRPVPMVVTSNYAPDDLLPDAEFVTSGSTWEEPVVKIDHRAFEAGIALIKRSFEIVSVDQGIDYRDLSARSRASGFRSGTYRITPPATDAPTAGAAGAVVEIRGRALHAITASNGEVVFAFTELCERPVGAGDIAELVGRFRRWTIVDVPPLSSCSPEGAQRFVNFVDVLCDADVRLDITSPVAPDELVRPVAGGRAVPPDSARLRSRLSFLEVTDG